MDKDARIYVAGDETLAGGALVRRLVHHGYRSVVNGTRRSPDPRDRTQVDGLLDEIAPAYVFVAGGKSGGIRANETHPAELMLDNLAIACHWIDGAYRHGVRKLLYLASSCVYPKQATPPMRVDSLWTGALESTSKAYAVAKLAGITLCQAYRRQHRADFVSGIPADIFGPGDDFSPDDSHVLAALMRRMHAAKMEGRDTVEIWGTGTPRREFIFADDLADACIFVMGAYSDAEPINLGGGADLSIRELANHIKDVVGYAGELRFDAGKPDGMPFKGLDSSALRALGWRPRVTFSSALAQTYEWFLQSERKGDTVHAG
jgi:GDP-L-fucose synthase